MGPDIKVVENTQKGQVIQSDLCTPESPRHYLHVSPLTLLINRSQWFYKDVVPWSPLIDRPEAM